MKLTFSFTIRFDRSRPEAEPEGRDSAVDAFVDRGEPTGPPELIAGAARHSIDDDFGAGRSFPIGFRRS